MVRKPGLACPGLVRPDLARPVQVMSRCGRFLISWVRTTKSAEENTQSVKKNTKSADGKNSVKSIRWGAPLITRPYRVGGFVRTDPADHRNEHGAGAALSATCMWETLWQHSIISLLELAWQVGKASAG